MNKSSFSSWCVASFARFRLNSVKLRLLGVAGFTALALSANAATNVLTNPGFELGNANGWTAFGSHAVESTNNTYYNGGVPGGSNVLAHTGEYIGKNWGSFSGGYNVNGYYQDAVAGPGSVWSASGWALSHQQDLMATNNQFWLEVTFRDSVDNILAMYRSAILDPASAAGLISNYWYDLAVTNEYDLADATYNTITNSVTSFTAPAGTTKARFQLVFAQITGYPGGSIYTDDLNLTKIAGSDPDITTSPLSQKKVEGQNVTFVVAAAGASTIHYQWQKGGVDISDGGNVSGTTTATLRINNVTLADAGNYSVNVWDNAGLVTSGTATLTVVTVAQASNVLGNPGFETGNDSSWVRFNGGGIVGAIGDPAGILEGSFASETWGTGNGSYNGIYQDVPTSPGQAFLASGSFLHSSSAVITGASDGWLEVQFMNGNGNMIALYRSEHVTSTTVQSVWMDLPVTNTIAFWGDYSVAGTTKYLVAPAGAAKARYQVTYHAADGGGAIFYDNMSLFLRIPVTVTLGKSGANWQVSFPTQIGVNYQVLYKNDLNDPAWQTLANVTGDFTGQASVSDSAAQGKRYYVVNAL